MEKNEAPKLDELDFAILSYLQQDGRMSFTVIAEKLKVSIGTIRTRFNKLIEDGTINIVGRVNPENVGFHAYAHIAVFVRPASSLPQTSGAPAGFSFVTGTHKSLLYPPSTHQATSASSL